MGSKHRTRFRASPLAGAREEIRQGLPIGPTLRSVLGDSLATRVLDVLCRVVEFEGCGAGARPAPGIRHQGTARVEFAQRPLRAADSAPVRRACSFLLCIMERMPHQGPARVVCPELWMGHQGGAKGAPRGKALANRVGVSVRELERYLTVFRQSGIIRQWQPPASELKERSPRLVGRRSGYAYACWELMGELPRELARILRAWRTGPSTTGPSTTGPSTTGPSTTGPSTTGPSTTGPSTTGPSTTGPSASTADYMAIARRMMGLPVPDG